MCTTSCKNCLNGKPSGVHLFKKNKQKHVASCLQPQRSLSSFSNLLTQVQSTLLGTTLYRTPTAFFCMAIFNVFMLQSLTRKMFQHKGCDNMLHSVIHMAGHMLEKGIRPLKTCVSEQKHPTHVTMAPEAQWQRISQLLVTMFPCFLFHVVHVVLWCLCFHSVSDFHCCVILLQYCTSIAC